jgi:hypothetical protein
VAGWSEETRIHPVPHGGLHITGKTRWIHGIHVSRKNKQGKKDRKRNLRNVLGKSSEVDEEDLEYYAKNDFYIPKSVYEGEVQIEMAVRTLNLLTNHKSIASDG